MCTIMNQRDRNKVADLENQNNHISTNGSNDHLMQIYFNFAYYFGVSPFRFKFDNLQGKLLHQDYTPQKIVCIIAHLYTMLYMTTLLRSIDLGKEGLTSNPENYIRLFASIMSVFRNGVYALFLFAYKNNFKSMMETIRNCTLLKNGGTSHTALKAKGLIIVHLTILVLVQYIAGYETLSELEKWSPSYLFESVVQNAKFRFFFTKEVDQVPKNIEDLTPIEISLGVVEMLFLMLLHLNQAFLNLLLLITSITLWLATRNFVRSIQALKNTATSDRKNGNQKMLMMKFEELKNLSFELSEAVGLVIFYCVLEGILFHAVEFDKIWKTSTFSFVGGLIDFSQSAHVVLFLYFACDSVAKMDSFKFWLFRQENRDLLPNNYIEHSILLDEFSSKATALKGIFTLDYAFVGNIVIVIMTFFIIMLQFQQASGGTKPLANNTLT